VLIDAKPPLENPEVSRMTRDAELAFATRGGELIVASRMVFSDVDLGEAQVVLDLHAIVGVVVERARFFLYLASGALLAGSILIAFSTSGRITRPLRRLRLAVNALAQGDTSARVDVSTRDEVADLTRAFNDMSASLSEKSRVETAFRRYVSDHVLQQVLDEPEAVQLLGERREITVLFIDIRRFTQLASRIEPERLVSYLNEAFELITDRLLEHGATVDKYIGDAILAYFGAPIEIEDHPARAVAAAISVQRSIAEFNQVRQSWRPPPERLDVGIGIQTGEVVVGNIGSELKMDYTAIGDAVNVASRLQKLADAGEILVTSDVAGRVGDLAHFEKLGLQQLEGREHPVDVLRVLC
jgi:class 3 adenylate cyclase